MRVSVFGVGYVGCVTAACLARDGHDVIGVDVDPAKIHAINQGTAPFFEPGLEQLIGQMVSAGRLRATVDHGEAIAATDIALICVGTPTKHDGSTRLDHLIQVFTSIGRELKKKDSYFVVALRSTLLPHNFEQELLPLLERYACKKIGPELGFAYNPEFLREGVALQDFHDAPWTIIGSSDSRAADTVAELYNRLSAPIIRTNINTAALVKYFSNAFHALKVAFGNEVGAACREMGVDGGEMMNIFVQDRKLNISPRYLKPGFAFGGSCLPKDLNALVSEMGKRGLHLPLLESIVPSNEEHLRNCINIVADTHKQRVGLVGLSFKAGTDDLRESPAVELAERLIGKGRDVRIYEPSIAPGRLHGSNLAFIERSIPHIWRLLLNDVASLVEHAEVIVIMQQIGDGDLPLFRTMSKDQICIDLAGSIDPAHVGAQYWSMRTPHDMGPVNELIQYQPV